VNYANAIWAIGVAPSIGYKITPSIAATLGIDVYKNFTNNLDQQTIVAPEARAANISSSLKIAEWDSGVRAGVELKLTKNLALNAMYRAGINQVMSNKTQQYRSNSLQM